MNPQSDPTPAIPPLVSPRLIVRALRPEDALPCQRLYDAIDWTDPGLSPAEALERRRSWVAWSIANERELARLHQPPLGDRAVVDRETGALVGLVGLVPAFMAFDQLPSFGGASEGAGNRLEIGLFWAITPGRQGAGLATEAAGALITYAFDVLRLARIVATTEHDNLASIGVMRRLGMTLERNPFPDPHFQTVGRLDAGARP